MPGNHRATRLYSAQQINIVRIARDLVTKWMNKTIKETRNGAYKSPMDIEYSFRDYLDSTRATGIPIEPLYPNLTLNNRVPEYGYHTSVAVNEEVSRSKPTDTEFQPGDLISIDVSVRLDGMCVAMIDTLTYRTPTRLYSKLVGVAYSILAQIISMLNYGNIASNAIAGMLTESAKQNNLTVIPNIVSHGIGLSSFEEPIIPIKPTDRNVLLRRGNVILAQIAITEGDGGLIIDTDKWLLITQDDSPTVHVGRTVIVGEL